MSNEILLDFDFSRFETDKSEQKHIPTKRQISRIFLGRVIFEVGGVDFGQSDCLLEMTSQMISILERLIFIGSKKEIYSYTESVFYLGFVKQGHTVRLTGSEQKESVFDGETFAAECDLIALSSAVGDLHRRGLHEAVRCYPGFLSRRSFLDNTKFAKEYFRC